MATQTPTTTSFDDADPRIDYSGPDAGSSWTVNTGDPQEFRSTSHVTGEAGSKATITFKGSSISVFGSIGLENNDGDPLFAPISSYTIDGQKSETFVGTPNAGGMQYGQMFYQSETLDAAKEHTLVIMNTASGKNPFRLDYFQIVGASGVDPALVDTGDTDSMTDGGGTTVITHKMVVWASVGAILGLLFLLAITVMLFMIVRQKRRKEYEMSGRDTPSCWPCRRKKPSKVTPFTFASPSDQYPLQDHSRRNRPPRRYPGYDPLNNDNDDSEALIGLRPTPENDVPPAYHNLSVRQPTGSRVAERGSSSDDKR